MTSVNKYFVRYSAGWASPHLLVKGLMLSALLSIGEGYENRKRLDQTDGMRPNMALMTHLKKTT